MTHTEIAQLIRDVHSLLGEVVEVVCNHSIPGVSDGFFHVKTEHYVDK